MSISQNMVTTGVLGAKCPYPRILLQLYQLEFQALYVHILEYYYNGSSRRYMSITQNIVTTLPTGVLGAICPYPRILLQLYQLEFQALYVHILEYCYNFTNWSSRRYMSISQNMVTTEVLGAICPYLRILLQLYQLEFQELYFHILEYCYNFTNWSSRSYMSISQYIVTNGVLELYVHILEYCYNWRSPPCSPHPCSTPSPLRFTTVPLIPWTLTTCKLFNFVNFYSDSKTA